MLRLWFPVGMLLAVLPEESCLSVCWGHYSSHSTDSVWNRQINSLLDMLLYFINLIATLVTQPELAFYSVTSGRTNAVEEAALGTLESRQAVLHAAFVSGSSF